MTKSELSAAVEAAKTETRNALQTVYDALNPVSRNRSSGTMPFGRYSTDTAWIMKNK